MKLLTMQLSYQDPFKPVDNSQMLSQMASMSTSEGISSLSTQMGSLNSVMTSNQALQASSLVGQNVLIPSNVGYLEEGGAISGMAAVGDGTMSNVKITVEDGAGQVIREFTIEGEHQGNVAFNWDGKDNDGNPVQPAKYSIKASGTVEGKSESIPALTYGRVESVTLGNGSTPNLVKLKGIGAIALTDILEIAGTGSNQKTTESTS